MSISPLTFTSLVSLSKKTKVNSLLQLQNSQDEQVASCSARRHTVGKWCVSDAIEDGKGRVRNQKLTGVVRGIASQNCNPRAGLGYDPNDKLSLDGIKPITDAFLHTEQEKYTAKAVQQGVQGVWTKWKDFVSRDISWNFSFSKSFYLERFCIGATFNTLSTPDNNVRFDRIDEAKCHQCNGNGCGIRHILNACPTSTASGKYTYRHNTVLAVIVKYLKEFIETPKPISQGIKNIHFVRETGEPITKRRKKPTFGILNKAGDWVILADLEKQLKFPTHIAEDISKRPDIVLFSDSLKIVVLIELTSPCEERFEESHSIKFIIYGPGSEIFQACKNNGWEVFVFPVEVGARGYAAIYLCRSV